MAGVYQPCDRLRKLGKTLGGMSHSPQTPRRLWRLVLITTGGLGGMAHLPTLLSLSRGQSRTTGAEPKRHGIGNGKKFAGRWRHAPCLPCCGDAHFRDESRQPRAATRCCGHFNTADPDQHQTVAMRFERRFNRRGRKDLAEFCLQHVYRSAAPGRAVLGVPVGTRLKQALVQCGHPAPAYPGRILPMAAGRRALPQADPATGPESHLPPQAWARVLMERAPRRCGRREMDLIPADNNPGVPAGRIPSGSS